MLEDELQDKLDNIKDFFGVIVEHLTDTEKFNEEAIISAIEEIYCSLEIDKEVPDSLGVWKRPKTKQDCSEYFALGASLARQQAKQYNRKVF